MKHITIDLDPWRGQVLRNKTALWQKAELLRRSVKGLARDLPHALKVLDRQVDDTAGAKDAIESVSRRVATLVAVAGDAHRIAEATLETEALLASLERSAQHLLDLKPKVCPEGDDCPDAAEHPESHPE